MTLDAIRSTLVAGGALLVLVAGGCGQDKAPDGNGASGSGSASASAAPSANPASAAGSGSVDVLLCDGKTTVHVPEGTPGTTIAGSLMQQWIAKNPVALEGDARHEVETFLGDLDEDDDVQHIFVGLK